MLKVYIKQILISIACLMLLPAFVNAVPTDTPAVAKPKMTAKPKTTPAAAPAKPKNMFIEGQDYTRVSNAVRNNPDVAQLIAADPNKVQVVFFFSYGCHGCEMFHAPFEKWAKVQEQKYGNKIVIYKYPVSFNQQWRMLAKLYYTMEYLDPAGKLNNAIFAAIHKQGLQMWQEAVMQSFFAKHGYNAGDFAHAFNSFGVNRQMKQADEISKSYKIMVSPDIIVNGPDASYRLDLTKAENKVDRFFQILDYLVAREIKLLH